MFLDEIKDKERVKRLFTTPGSLPISRQIFTYRYIYDMLGCKEDRDEEEDDDDEEYDIEENAEEIIKKNVDQNDDDVKEEEEGKTRKFSIAW